MKPHNRKEKSIKLKFPLPDEKIFRSESVSEILELLVNNPHQEFTISDLREITSKGGSSVKIGLEILESLDLIEKRSEGKKTLVRINTERINKPKDPIFSIPQDNFRQPIRSFKKECLDRLDYIAGIIVFGSVARGEADRASDIDLMLIVEDGLTPARREATNIASELQEEEIAGQRYEFEVLVESLDSAEKQGSKIKNILSEGVVIHRTKSLEDLKERIFRE